MNQNEDGNVQRALLAIVIPVFNDWVSLRELIQDLSMALPSQGNATHLVIVDDGSTEDDAGLGDAIAKAHFQASIVRLKRNVGHQRAIAIGLCHAVSISPDEIIIMDADGEDRPEDVQPLLSTLRGSKGGLVVANRQRRSEGFLFNVFYQLYKMFFRLLTGTSISFGNFSAMNLKTARRLVSMHELLLHVPATMIKSRCPIVHVGTDRGRRYAGKSKMSLVSLIIHGVSAVAVYGERAFTRIIIFSAMVFGLSVIAMIVAVMLKFIGMATPGWVTSIAGIVIILLVQNAAVALGGLLVVLKNNGDVTLLAGAIAEEFTAEINSVPVKK